MNVRRRRRTRAQTQHVFAFFLIAVVIVVTFILGMKFMRVLFSKGCDTQKQQFEGELRDILATYDTYGTKQNIVIPVGCDAEMLCFIGGDVTDRSAIVSCNTTNLQTSLLSQLSISTTASNIYLVKGDTLYDIAREPKIRVNANEGVGTSNNGNKCLCIQRKGGGFPVRVLGGGTTITFQQVG